MDSKINVATFYHNFIYGDLCEECYNKKKELDERRIENLKKIILLQGKKQFP